MRKKIIITQQFHIFYTDNFPKSKYNYCQKKQKVLPVDGVYWQIAKNRNLPLYCLNIHVVYISMIICAVPWRKKKKDLHGVDGP
jgi:hypothetical protein